MAQFTHFQTEMTSVHHVQTAVNVNTPLEHSSVRERDVNIKEAFC